MQMGGDQMSLKLEATLKKVDRVFEAMFHKGITVKEEKDSWGENTPGIYSDLVKALIREVHVRYGVADAKKIDMEKTKEIIMERAERFSKGELSESYNVKTVLAAMKAFNVGAEQTSIFKGNSVNLGDVDAIRTELKERNLIRYSKSSTIMRATPDQCEKVLSNIQSKGYQTDMRDIAYKASRVAYETGGRITATLKLRPQDIDFENNRIHFNKDKGGLSRGLKISQETSDFLKELSVGKKPNQMIFTAKNKDGTFKSVVETRKAVQRIVKNASSEVRVTEKVTVKDENGKKKEIEVEKRFTPHSFRKGFAVNRTKEYLDRFHSSSAMKRYIQKRIKEDPKLAKKIQTLRTRLNRGRKTLRSLTPEEYAIFFTSVDLGHFRNDVIKAFYTTANEVKEYFQI